MEIKYRRKNRTWTNEELAADYNNGMKLKELTVKYSISKQGIYYILRKVSTAPKN